MNSSTSHSDRGIPVLGVKLLSVAVVAWVACVAYTFWLNPEVRFYAQLSTIQDAWSRKMDGEHGQKVVVFGGSSCMFSINGEQMLADYGLSTVNRGLAAGMGVKVVTLHALADLRSGDTLIVAFEPGQLCEPAETTSLATQFSYAVGHSDWAVRPALDLPGMPRATSLLELRPGSGLALTLIGKLLSGRDLYRYGVADVHPSGWVVTNVRVPLAGPPGHGPRLSDDMARFLPTLKSWCAQRGIRVAYSLPWAYCPAGKLDEFKQANATILRRIAEMMPVLKEPLLGADSNAQHFADTAWHLNEGGSRLRTDELGRAVKQWSLWSSGELKLFAGPNIE
jgi:hypothetical protein